MFFDFETLAGSTWKIRAWESVGQSETEIDLPFGYEEDDLTWDDIGSAVDNVIYHVNESNGLMWTNQQLFEHEPHLMMWEGLDLLYLEWGYMKDDTPVMVTTKIERV